MRYSTILVLIAVLSMWACKNQQKPAVADNESDVLKRSQLVGTWRMSTPTTTHPPMIITYHFKASGEYTYLIHLPKDGDYVPRVNPVQHHEGYWNFSRIDKARDVIVFKPLIVNSAAEETLEVSIDDDTMMLKPLAEGAHKNWATMVLKRVRQ